MTTPAMCAGCGLPLELPALRLAAITPEGRVDLVHEVDAERCGPVIVAALAAAAPDDGHRNPSPWLRKLLTTIEAHTEALALLPDGCAAFDLPARLLAYEARVIRAAMDAQNQDIAAAAVQLGIGERTLYRKLRELPSGWQPRHWTAEQCDAALLDLLATGPLSSTELLRRVPDPAHWTPL